MIETYIVDSFTVEPFKGNPAGVCILQQDLTEDQMLSIAKELGLSETAFVQNPDVNGTCSIRYFSPKMEIPLCGHATLASAKVLFEKNHNMEKIHFITVQNIDLRVEKEEEWIKMEFPVYETTSSHAPSELLNALGLSEINNCVYNDETKILVLEIENCQELRDLKPDYEALLSSHNSINGVLVTALSERNEFDFESRYFWPWSGTNEDPATGGTHTFLTKYWGERLNKTKLKSFQCSERTGFMEVELIGDNKVTLKSTAHIILEGRFRL